MDRNSEGIHGVADILPGFGPGDVGSIPTGSVSFTVIFSGCCDFFSGEIYASTGT